MAIGGRSTAGPRDISALLTRRADLLLAAVVVGVVAMMIIPLPTPLLDVLITANISFAVLLLLVSIYVANPLSIAAFPSMLLITTLFRLGLNVSSTRLILLQADAGDVILSFGNFVVAGNIVVGVVVFLILTIIQFVVIAKGGERVAEVAARFALDAMPGKQMAIDADLRAGSIELEQARRQRSTLQRESQLYGSMDGALKFVKGDAVAAILITLINIGGGLLIGVMQRKLAVGEAATVYTLLTVGDGLVSQIPALLISIAAGIVVTRVASEDAHTHLGADIGQQVLAHPRAIALSAGLLVLLALIPGLPTLPFLLIGALLGSLAYSLHRRARRAASVTRPRLAEAGGDDEAGREQVMPPPSLIALELGEELTPTADHTQGGQLLDELIPGVREMLHGELGLWLPGVNVRAGADLLAAHDYRILIGEVPVAEGSIDPTRPVVIGGERPAEAEPVELPGVGGPAYRLLGVAAGMPTGAQLLDPATQIALHLGAVLREHAGELMGIQETQELLDQLERTHPALVHEVVPKLVSIQTLADVLSRLLDEAISIRSLRDVLEALAEWAPSEKDPVVLTEHVRAALQRYISHKYGGQTRAVRALMLDPAIEDAVRESIHRTAKGSYLALEPELGREIVELIARELSRVEAEQLAEDPRPVVLTSMEVRRYVRRLLEVELPQLPVLSYNELQASVSVQPVARVSLG